MSYLYAKKGIKKIILGQVFAIAAVVLTSGTALLLKIYQRFFSGMEIIDALPLILTGVGIGVISIALTVLTAAISIVGYAQAAKAEADFKKAMFCAIAVGALSIFGLFFKVPNATVSTILTSAGTIVEMFVMVFTVSGTINLLTACEQTEAADRGNRVLNIIVITYIISAINSLVMRIFELSEHVKVVSVIIGAVEVFISVYQYVIFMRYLSRSMKVFPNE